MANGMLGWITTKNETILPPLPTLAKNVLVVRTRLGSLIEARVGVGMVKCPQQTSGSSQGFRRPKR